MNRRFVELILWLAVSGLLAGCGPNEEELLAQIKHSVAETLTAVPTRTAYPTLTPYPTATARPTLTPYPSYTPVPLPTLTGLGEWVEGHFWSIKVIEVQTETSLEGKHPSEDRFVLVDVQWKANGLAEKHAHGGIDFELVDNQGEQYLITGMIYDPDTFEPFGPNAEYRDGRWTTATVRGNKDDIYRLVFDVPSSAQGLKLWFRSFPLIDLGLE
jgi:hypothetical protein